jgi:hypothetical protein
MEVVWDRLWIPDGTRLGRGISYLPRRNASGDWSLIMEIVDIVLMVLFIGGAVYLLYRSLWKNKGHCQGCDAGTCEIKKKYDSKRC